MIKRLILLNVVLVSVCSFAEINHGVGGSSVDPARGIYGTGAGGGAFSSDACTVPPTASTSPAVPSTPAPTLPPAPATPPAPTPETAPPPREVADGGQILMTKCAGCHSAEKNKPTITLEALSGDKKLVDSLLGAIDGQRMPRVRAGSKEVDMSFKNSAEGQTLIKFLQSKKSGGA